MVTIQQGLRADGVHVSMAQLCRWFDQPRRTVYYRPTKSPPKVKPKLAEPIKALIEAEPSFGYRTVAGLLGMNKNTVQRIFQLMGWQVRKRAVGHRPRIEALPSVARAPDARWATDLCRVWGGRDGWLTLALVMDCHTRQVLGWQLSRSGRATTAAAAALEQALITRYGVLARVPTPFLLRSDNGLVFTSRLYTRLVRSYGPRQEFITPAAGVTLAWRGSGVDEEGFDTRSGQTRVRINPRFYRPAEVDLLVGSAAKAKEKLGWQAETDLETLCRLMVDADLRRNDQGVSF